jgi:TPR repeat protein
MKPIMSIKILFMICFCLMITDAGFARSIDELKQKAQQGDANAQNELGNLYRNGDGGVSQDYLTAMKWYRKSAEQGHADAQNNLGDMCRKAGDCEEALKCYTRSAEQEHTSAQYTLGEMYEKGECVQADAKKALEYYRLAAKPRSATEKKDSDKQDEPKSTASKGEDKPDKPETEEKTEEPKAPEVVQEQKKTEEPKLLEIMAVQEKTEEPKVPETLEQPKVPKADTGDELWYMAWEHYRQKQYGEAAKPMKLSAEKGHKWAQHYLGMMYYHGRGMEKNHRESIKWIRKSAQQGIDKAQCQLGYMYNHREGIDSAEYGDADKNALKMVSRECRTG